MRVVADEIKAMSQEDILSFEEAGEITIAGHCIKRTDIKVVNRVQKLRKKSALAPTDSVEVYFSSPDDDKSVSAGILESQHAPNPFIAGHMVIAEETYKNILTHDFKITLSRSRPD
ncbi:hypothetical protein Tco_1087694 [Tanacetum coccineum]